MTSALSKGVLGMLLVALPCVPTSAVAGCRGFLSGLVCDVPVVGPAVRDIDEGIAGIKDRGSDVDVAHQVTGLGAWDNPVGKPAAAPLPSVRFPAPPGGGPVATPTRVPQ